MMQMQKGDSLAFGNRMNVGAIGGMCQKYNQEDFNFVNGGNLEFLKSQEIWLSHKV